jgi:hypothetical protein
MILMFLWMESGASMRIIPPHLALFRHSKVAGAGAVAGAEGLEMSHSRMERITHIRTEILLLVA